MNLPAFVIKPDIMGKFFFFVFFVVVAISWAAPPRHMEVPRLGVESEL